MVYAAFRRPIVVKSFDGSASFRVRVHPSAVSHGGTSSIFKGKTEDSTKSEAVALKVFRRSGQGPATSELFRRELQALKNIEHPFIVPVFGAAELGDLMIIATRWAPNGNLLQFLRAHPSANRPMLLLQVAIAVAYLHTDLRIVHGDLKCENVLVSEDGKAYLTDFGLSTTLDKLASDATTSTQIRNWNTLRFASPELLFDTARSNSGRLRSKTPASDVYAFGMLVVQAFSCRKPWPTYEGPGLFMLLLDPPTHPRPACHGQFGLTDVWWKVCLACWRRDPGQRPEMESVKDVLAESILIGGPSTMIPDSRRVGDAFQRNLAIRTFGHRGSPIAPAVFSANLPVAPADAPRRPGVIVFEALDGNPLFFFSPDIGPWPASIDRHSHTDPLAYFGLIP